MAARSAASRSWAAGSGSETPGPDLVAAYVKLRTACVRDGHALGQKAHEADRWVADTALWLDVPLVAHDNIFRGVPGLELLSRLGNV